jgi:arylsulfatase A-like enzyme
MSAPSGSSRARARGAISLAIALASGCAKDGPADTPGSTTSQAASAVKAPAAKGAKATNAPQASAVIDFLAAAEDCTFGHRGVLIDLGDSTARARMSGARLVMPDLEVREHEGASWVSVRARSLELSFVASTELKSDAGIVIEARSRGGAAKSASAYLNGKPIGTLGFTKGETTIASARAQGVILRGTNELLLRFNGGSRSQHDQLAEIDWIRIGPNDGDAPYSAPTRSDAVATVSIAGTPRRSVSLRAPGFARCSAFIPNGSILEGFIGATGGEAEAEVRVLVDRAEPRIVGSFRLGGPTDPPGWRPFSLPLGDIGTIAGVELVAKTSSKGARVAFAEARVAPPAELDRPSSEVTPPARGVVLVALGSTSRRISIHGGSINMPELASLANGGIVFDAHRATSSYASGALGSMLTGLSPREHGASDADAMLSGSVFTIAEAARQAGIVTAMFTANPTTTAPYGFARGWETFVARLPGEEAPAPAVFDDAGKWLDAHKNDRFFVVIHARGGHPPWDVTSEELKELPPQGYQGSLEPKAAGESLAKARKAAGGRSFADADRERAFALHAKALAAHDTALGSLVARLRTLGRDKDTVWIVTGDVGVDAAARVPFLEDDALEEGALAIPLVLRGIGPRPRERVTTATSSVDIARTILESFGLPSPPQLRGESLWSVAGAGSKKPSVERPLVSATTTRFSARWGAFAVIGTRDREVKVCNLSLDPDCVIDVRPSHPLAAEVLHSLAWSELVVKGGRKRDGGDKPTVPAAEPPLARAVADGPTSAALKVWGR